MAKVITRTPANGGAVFELPNSPWQVMWIGPGGGLFLSDAFTPGGMMTPIEHPSASGTFDDFASANAAVDAFIAEVASRVEPADDGKAA